jgi:hypothetical protein
VHVRVDALGDEGTPLKDVLAASASGASVGA